MGFGAPQHLYSHRVRTFLDALLHDADGVAERQAQSAKPRVGWIRSLEEPRTCFLHNGVQLHNLDRHAQLLQTGALECPPRKSLDTYHAVGERGVIQWGAHIRTMARCEGLAPSTPSHVQCAAKSSLAPILLANASNPQRTKTPHSVRQPSTKWSTDTIIGSATTRPPPAVCLGNQDHVVQQVAQGDQNGLQSLCPLHVAGPPWKRHQNPEM